MPQADSIDKALLDSLQLDCDPVQFVETPESNMWLACLYQAFLDLCHGAGRIKESAKLWFSSDESGVGSAEWVCSIFGLSPTSFKTKLSKGVTKKTTKAGMTGVRGRFGKKKRNIFV